MGFPDIGEIKRALRIGKGDVNEAGKQIFHSDLKVFW